MTEGEPTYYLFLAGDACPEWIERVVPPWSGIHVSFCADAEAFRYHDRVEIRPLFPLTSEHPAYLYISGDGSAEIHGAPTVVLGTSRHFPSPSPNSNIVQFDGGDS